MRGATRTEGANYWVMGATPQGIRCGRLKKSLATNPLTAFGKLLGRQGSVNPLPTIRALPIHGASLGGLLHFVDVCR